MTEFEFLSLAYEASHALQTEETTFLTVLFGYLLAAHFLGARVSKTQLTIFNSIYLIVAFGLVYNMWLHWEGTYGWINSSARLSDPTVANIGGIHTIAAMAIYLSLIFASLYFMWTVRRTQVE